MDRIFLRPLNTAELVINFLKALNVDFVDENVTAISVAESHIKEHGEEYSTLTNPTNRHPEYRDAENRALLWDKIVSDLIDQKRQADDENIKLTIGGALPVTDVSYEKVAFIITGLPASGKSTIANQIADEHGAVIIDSDYVKRKLPEYRTDEATSAHIVHRESRAIVFGEENDVNNDFEPFIYRVGKEGANMVIPMIGHMEEGVVGMADLLIKTFGYSVNYVHVNLNRIKAAKRAFERFIATGRYVSLSLIFDGYSNDSTLVYYKMQIQDEQIFSSFVEVSTTEEEKKLKILRSTNSRITKLFENA